MAAVPGKQLRSVLPIPNFDLKVVAPRNQLRRIEKCTGVDASIVTF
jgi:hypothetical protein